MVASAKAGERWDAGCAVPCGRCGAVPRTYTQAAQRYDYPVGAAIVRLCERCWTDCYGRPPMAGPMALGNFEAFL